MARAVARPVRKTRRRRVLETLLGEIDSGALAPGARMQSVVELCARFGTGRSTVQLALEELAARGLIERRHGLGTFVAGAPDAAGSGEGLVICMTVSGHVFSDLHALLVGELQARGHIPMVIDTGIDSSREMLRRAVHSDARTLVVHGGLHFPFDELREAAARDKALIGIIAWETEALRDRAHRVLVDHVEAGALVGRHLAARGHRRVLVLGTSTQVDFLKHPPRRPFRGDQQRGFLDACREAGISWRAVDASRSSHRAVPLGEGSAELISLDPKTVLPFFRGRNACTAVFGMLDAHAWALQDLLAAEAPRVLSGVEIVGYGDTPWSRFGKPPFTSVSWNIESIARETALLVDDARVRRVRSAAGAPIEVFVKPRLIVRGNR